MRGAASKVEEFVTVRGLQLHGKARRSAHGHRAALAASGRCGEPRTRCCSPVAPSETVAGGHTLQTS